MWLESKFRKKIAEISKWKSLSLVQNLKLSSSFDLFGIMLRSILNKNIGFP